MSINKLNLILAAFALLLMQGCASAPTQDVDADIAEATQGAASSPSAASGATDSSASAETSESDLKDFSVNPEPAKGDTAQATPQATPQAAPPAEDAAAAAPSPVANADNSAVSGPTEESLDGPDTTANNPAPAGTGATDIASGPPAEATPPPPAVEAPAPEVAASPELPPGAAPAVVTGLDFKANVAKGSIILKTNQPVEYITHKNPTTNQLIIELKNTSIPTRFRRPYTTKEFNSPIASINGYQSKENSARIVIQLRDSTEPSVVQKGNIITVAGDGSVSNPVAKESHEPTTIGEPATTASATETASANDGSDDQPSPGDKKLFAPTSVSDFLTGNTKFYGRPISIEVKDSDIRDVFRLISEETGLNIVVGDDVSGKVSLKLRQIPWDQALSVLLQSKQLGYVRQGSILRIAPLATLQKESDSARGVIEAQRLLQPLHVQVFPVSYAKSEDLEAQAKDFLSPRGKAKADSRTNTVVVTDIDENLAKIKALIQRLDTQTPQVLIEAKVIEARETFGSVVGVNWGFSGQAVQTGTNANGPVTFTPNFQSNPSSSPTVTSLGIQMGTLDVFGDLTATLRLLESENIVKVVSAPRIVTLDRVQAMIEQTTQFPVFSTTTTGTTSTTGVTVSAQPTTTVTFQDVKLQLQVRPQITNDGSVIMDLDVVREFAEDPTIINGSEARAVDKRHAKTQVLVDNGDTVVIGGIYQSDASSGETGIPWLRNIPFLGALFKEKTANRDKNELVIFLTPRILNREKSVMKAGDAS